MQTEDNKLMKWDRENPTLTTSGTRMILQLRPSGLIWDGVNYSCGYDATCTILANIWFEDPNMWLRALAYLSGFVGDFALAMRAVVVCKIYFDHARNVVRKHMHTSNPENFPYGPNYTSIDRITSTTKQALCPGQTKMCVMWLQE